MIISKVGKVVMFEKICKKIYQKISDLKNLKIKLLVESFDLNYKTD